MKYPDSPTPPLNALSQQVVEELRKKIEEQQSVCASIVNSSHDAILSKTLNGEITSWNHAAEVIFGYTDQEIIGKNINLLIPTHLQNEEKNIIKKIAAGEIVDHYETERIRKDGNVINVTLTISPIKNAAGVVVGASKISRDITDRKKYIEQEKRSIELLIANKELTFQNDEKEKWAVELIIANKELAFQNNEKEKRAAELAIANQELAFQNDEKEKRAAELIIANKELAFQNTEKEKRAAELVIANKELAFQNDEKEKRANELIIANKELIFQNNEKENRAAELVIANKELVFQNEEKENRAAELVIANKELAFQNDEKGKRAAELAVANKELLFQNDEKENRAFELSLAYSELKKSEEQLLSVNKELEAFSYSVSHDLRAPLRAIYGYSQILKEDHEGVLDTDGLRVMNNIMKSAKKMGQLVDDLLAFSRLGRRELQEQTIDMDNMVHEICDELKMDLQKSKIQFQIQPLAPALADNSMIRQVWINLISNAIKYTRYKETPVITIGSQIKDGEITYYIRDNGAGFDMRYADKLFGVFQRLHSEDKFEGTGVGLAIVQRVIAKHQGRIWAEAKVNEGACFYFTLQKP